MKDAVLQRGVVALVLVAVVGGVAARAQAEIGDLVADAVLGESSFTDSVALPIGPSTFAYPRGIAIDRSVTPNRVYVSDSFYHRVLGWRDVDGLASGAPADIVIGQPDFVSFFCNQNPYVFASFTTPTLSTLCAPQGLAVDGAGNLYVADTLNCRVLIFRDPFGTDQVPDVVLGQATGCQSSGGPQNPLYAPSGVAVDGAGNVYVTGGGGCGALEYDQPLTTDTVPDRVYDLPYMTEFGFCSNGAVALSVDPDGHLYAATRTILYEYDTPLTKTTWDHTLGTVLCNDGGESSSSSSTCMAVAAVADSGGHLYVADAGNSRVLEFDSPFTINQAARVFGQPGFVGNAGLFQDACNTGGPSASSLCLQIVIPTLGGATYAQGAALDLDGAGNLWVADTLNHRVLRYDNPLSSDTAADFVLGHTTMEDIRRPLIASPQPGFTMSFSTFAHLRLDTANSRILIEAEVYQRPVGVIGQPDFNTTGCNSGGLSASSLCNPASATVDGPGDLWIADSGNNRVLEYLAPWYTVDTANKQIIVKHSADRVFGQADFTSSACQAGPSGLCNPYAVTWDAQQNLYISDTGNNRIVHHINPLADTIGDEVIGQPDFNTTGCNSGGVSANSLCDPRGITVLSHVDPWGVDQGDDLYVADHGNNRVLRYNMSASRTAAMQVFGQGGNMMTNACSAGADGLCGPSDVGVDGGDDLLIADTDNNRVLEFTTPVATDTTADLAFGQPDLDSTLCNNGGASARSLCQPTGIFTSNVYGGEVYIADAGNQRVLRYDSPYCVKDFQLTPTTRGIRGVHSHPVSTHLNVIPGGAGKDQLKLSGGMVLLDNGVDGPLNIHQGMQEPAITLSTSNGVVFRGDIAYLDNVRATANGGVYKSDLRGMIDSGIDWFRISEAWHAPRNQPQYFHYGYKGEAIGLDLSSFTESEATLRLQFGSVCLDTALRCSNTRSGRKCTPAWK